jgi:shikimate kinase
MSENASDIRAAVRRALDRPIVLIGMMGTGKTKIGAMLARALDLEFVDSDDEIQRAAGCSVAEIFERFGEASFRDGEKRVLKRLIADAPKVIATGGGAVTNFDTAQLIWDDAISVWLKADLAVLLERVGRTDRRPLLKNGDPAEILSGLLEKREPIYARADITVDSSTGDAEALVNEILERVEGVLAGKKKV